MQLPRVLNHFIQRSLSFHVLLNNGRCFRPLSLKKPSIVGEKRTISWYKDSEGAQCVKLYTKPKNKTHMTACATPHHINNEKREENIPKSNNYIITYNYFSMTGIQ